jgi:hypothetical protein
MPRLRRFAIVFVLTGSLAVVPVPAAAQDDLGLVSRAGETAPNFDDDTGA